MKQMLLAMLLLLQPMLAQGVTVAGKTYPFVVTVEGKDLKLVGVGLREKWWFDVYTMAAFSESGECDVEAMIKEKGMKYIRLDLLRDVSAEKMGSTIAEAFAAHMPKNAKPELNKQLEQFKSYFKKNCTKGTKVEFTYVPGTGTTFKQNGEKLGPPFAGPDFQMVLWDIYFGKKTCCEDLKKQIIKTCKSK